MTIIHIQETDSTNTYLKDLLSQQQLEEGTIVVTDFQTRGKGQRGNGWESDRGKNLLFSTLLYPSMVRANEQFIISQIVSLAIKDYLDKLTDGITIKWPNDIYWREKKICGILIENTLTEDRMNESIIGIGININQTEFESDAPNPVSLKQITGKEYDSNTILTAIQRNIYFYYNKLKNNKGLIINKYKNSLFRRNGYHLYNDGQKDFLARIKDVEPNGILVLETTENTEKFFAFKEVKFVIAY